jgi:hypothetical protein
MRLSFTKIRKAAFGARFQHCQAVIRKDTIDELKNNIREAIVGVREVLREQWKPSHLFQTRRTKSYFNPCARQ